MTRFEDVPIVLVSDRGSFLAKIAEYEHSTELFIDIETVDWRTPSPRVALLQVWAGREVTVFDVLVPEVGKALVEHFVPRVMANANVRKWAHSAGYEKRLLGGASVQNLSCTMRLARGIAFHRLPTVNLSLASLAEALFGAKVDKTLQKADWAIRPLPEEYLRYAAGDTTWCARLRAALEALERPPPPEKDDPAAIDEAFPEAKLRELRANKKMKALRESVRALMLREETKRFSRFTTWYSKRLEVPLRAFVTEVERVDPARMLEIEMRVTNEKLNLLNGGADRVLKKCRTWQGTLFRTPRLSLPRGEGYSYAVVRDDAERVTHDYEACARAQRMATSLVDELKQRMRAVLELRGETEFCAWTFAPGPVSRAIDVRDALRLAPGWADTMVPLTRMFQLVIGEDAVAALVPATNTKVSSAIRWCSKSDVMGIEAQESRFWSDSEEEVE